MPTLSGTTASTTIHVKGALHHLREGVQHRAEEEESIKFEVERLGGPGPSDIITGKGGKAECQSYPDEPQAPDRVRRPRWNDKKREENAKRRDK